MDKLNFDEDFFEDSEMTKEDVESTIFSSGLVFVVDIDGCHAIGTTQDDYIEYGVYMGEPMEVPAREMILEYSKDGTIKSGMEEIARKYNTKYPEDIVGGWLCKKFSKAFDREKFLKMLASKEYRDYQEEVLSRCPGK